MCLGGEEKISEFDRSKTCLSLQLNEISSPTKRWNRFVDPMTFKPLNYGPRTHPPTTVRGNQLNLTQTRLTN